MPFRDSLTCTFVVSCAQPKHGELQLGHGTVDTKSMSRSMSIIRYPDGREDVADCDASNLDPLILLLLLSLDTRCLIHHQLGEIDDEPFDR